jgi:hypothetical protein
MGEGREIVRRAILIGNRMGNMNKKKLLELLLDEAIEDGGSSSEVPFEVGEKYFIRTVTYFATGKVKRVTGNFLELEDAAWIADTGRFQEAIMKGVLNEVEPVEVPMYINISSITDAFLWKHKLPREQK